MQTSSRYGIQYPSLDRSDRADIPTDIKSMIDAIETSAMYGQGALSSRPVSTSASPGKQGRFYMATDQTPHLLYYDYGTGWDVVGVTGVSINRSGLLSARPNAESSLAGVWYYATDQVALYYCDGSSWIRVGDQPGDLYMTMNTTPNPGRILLQGQAWPSTTGIYAALYSKWGGSVLPDARGRMPVILGTHVDVDTPGKNDGLTVNSRRPKHKHPVNDPGHSHQYTNPGQSMGTGQLGGVSGPNSSQNTGSAQTGITVGPQTGAEPTDGPAWITINMEAKL